MWLAFSVVGLGLTATLWFSLYIVGPGLAPGRDRIMLYSSVTSTNFLLTLACTSI